MPPTKPLKTKVSTWKNYLRLFSPKTGRISLVIPSQLPYQRGSRVPVLVFLPQGEPLKAIGIVLQVVRGPDGSQRGLGITLQGVNREEEARIELMRQHALRLDAPPEHAAAPAPAPPRMPAPAPVPAPEPREPTPRPTRPTPAPTPPAEEESLLPPVRRQTASRTRAPQVTAGAPQVPPQEEVPEDDSDFRYPHPGLLDTPANPDIPIVGMDLGTTRSSVAVVENNEVLVLQARNGLWDIPSVVGFTEVGDPVVGIDAREMFIIDPTHAIVSPKRLLGRRYQERELEPYLAGMAMAHSEGPNGEVQVHPRGKTLSIPQVCAPLLFSMRVMAQEFLDQQVTDVVLTIPVSYDDYRRRAIRDAASLAGLRVLEFIEEPTAAVLAHHFDDSFRGLIAVYDFGGGTFDFSVVEVRRNNLEVVSTAGDTWLGGDDFDLAMASAAANAFWRETKIEIRNQVVRWQRLLIAAEKAKRELSFKEQTILGLPDAALTPEGSLALRYPCNRDQFNEICAELIERSLETCRETLEIQPEEVDTVYLSGGTSAIPAVRDALTEMFGKPPRMAIPPERAVVIGAALHAANLYQKRKGPSR